MAENLLQLRMDKCSFLMQEINFLGYKVNALGITSNGENVDDIKNYPVPQNVKALHSFLGLCSYFRRFVRNFGVISKPLYNLLKKNAKFVFGKEQIIAFETLRDKLMSAPILAIYSPFKETELHCDASSIGFGAILLQKQEDNKFQPVFYFSRNNSLRDKIS